MRAGKRLRGRAELAGLRLLALTATCRLMAPLASRDGGEELLVPTAEQQG